MLILISILRKARRIFDFYYYNTPLPILTTGEATVFHAIFLLLSGLAIYWLVYRVPCFGVHVAARSYYYATGTGWLE